VDSDIDRSVLGDHTVEQGDFVIFFTGFLALHGYGTPEYFNAHPQLSWDLIDHLIDREVSFIGIDAAGVRRGDEHGVADRRAETGGTYIIENIDRVDLLSKAAATHDFKVFTGWTGLQGFSGLSCRVIADMEEAGQ
jgi:kynurenine formamidase